jgi:hypothetical protein
MLPSSCNRPEQVTGDIPQNEKYGVTGFKIRDDGQITWKQDNTSNTKFRIDVTATELTFKNGECKTILTLTRDGMKRGYVIVNRQTGTAYTIVESDHG